jgi:integrase
LEELVKAAGLPGLLHDFRRSAVRNMIRRGVPTAREISGHKTDAVFNRYNIVSVADLQDAAKKIEAGAGAKPVIHSSFIVEGQEEENRKEGDARKPV